MTDKYTQVQLESALDEIRKKSHFVAATIDLIAERVKEPQSDAPIELAIILDELSRYLVKEVNLQTQQIELLLQEDEV